MNEKQTMIMIIESGYQWFSFSSLKPWVSELPFLHIFIEEMLCISKTTLLSLLKLVKAMTTLCLTYMGFVQPQKAETHVSF